MVTITIINLLMYLSGVLTNQLLVISAAQKRYKQAFMFTKYISQNWSTISIAIGLMLPFVFYTNDFLKYLGVSLSQTSAVGFHCFMGGLMINVLVAKLQKFIK